MIDPLAMSNLASELGTGERLIWTGMPNPRITFHSDDWALIPFSLMFGGFTIVWETLALADWTPSLGRAGVVLWGVPFVIVGQYLIWGRFLYDGWLKRRTYYGVTNFRALIVQQGLKRKVSSAYLDSCRGSKRRDKGLEPYGSARGSQGSPEEAKRPQD